VFAVVRVGIAADTATVTTRTTTQTQPKAEYATAMNACRRDDGKEEYKDGWRRKIMVNALSLSKDNKNLGSF
jgi:hypothetical protein